jgi:hypothetical protein
MGERYGNVLQDVQSFLLHPRNNIFNHALLAPSPFLTTAATLDTGLV